MGRHYTQEFPRDIRAGDVFEMLSNLYRRLGAIMSALDDLSAQVTASTNAEASAVTLIQGLADQLKAAIAAGPGSNDAALVDLASKLHASADALGAAIVANTPAQATPPADAAPASTNPTV